MIQLTRLNHAEFYLNPDLIEHIEITPDTVIALASGHKYVVREGAQEVVNRIVAYRRRCVSPGAGEHVAAGDGGRG